MKIELKSWGAIDEANAIEAFLNWQCQPPISRNDKFPGVLEYTKGHPAACVIVYKDGNSIEIVLKGFKEVLKFWEDNGLWLC